MNEPRLGRRPIEMWGGIECTVNRVGDTWFDQVVRSGHHARPDDLDRFAALGLRALRYPALWERMAPEAPERIDWTWTDARLHRLRALGMRPIVGLLHHGSGPAYTSLVDARFPELFAAFAGAVARRYPWVTDYTPINEPLTTARFSGLYGHWYPHGRDDRTFVRALLTQARGVVLAMRAIRAVQPEARLVQTEDCGRTFGTLPTAAQVRHEEHRRWLTWDLLCGRVDASHPLWGCLLSWGASPEELAFFVEQPCPPDVLGLNYYLTSDRYLDDRLDRYPASAHGGNGELRYADIEAVRVRGEGIVGHEAHLFEAWARYRRPVAITEVHLACSRDEQLRWLMESWDGAHRAQARGADVVAVTPWALLGSFDWNSLVTRDAGDYEPGIFDLRAPTPRPTALASAVRALAANDGCDHPVLSGPGWWHRPERLIYPDVALPSRPAEGVPVVVVGVSPMMAAAIRASATVRGLAVRILARGEFELADPTAVDSMMRKLRPWAVICAVADDDLANLPSGRMSLPSARMTEHLNLAAACRRRGIRLVTLSSSAVFGGGDGHVYTELDVPAPRTAFGSSVAEIERRVRDLLPESLVARPGRLFAAWNPDVDVIDLATSASSWTYVPHFVEAALDLLIDSDSGIWHLFNGAPEQPARTTPYTPHWAVPIGATNACRAALSAPVVLRSLRGWPLPALDQALLEYTASRRAHAAGHERA